MCSHVAIVGAGLTGLLTAHGLKKAGFNVTVYDAETSLNARPRDWTIVLHWALPTFKKLLPPHILDNLPQAICNPNLDFTPEVECLPAINGKTGGPLFTSPMPGSRRVSRQRLRKVLAEGIDVQWGKKLVGLQPDANPDGPVVLSFEDGTSAAADYVLGTDGPGSKVRDLLFGGTEAGKVKPSGFLIATLIMKHGDKEKVEAVVKAHPVATVLMGSNSVGGIGVMYVDDPEDKSTWTTFWVKIWRRGVFPDPPAHYGKDALAYLKDTTTDLVEPFQSQLDWTPLDGDAVCFIDEMKTWEPAGTLESHAGRVVLAGDAAHPMLVYRGQGFQHAILDADNYVDALVKLRGVAGAGREEVFAKYNEEMVERGAKAVVQSLKEAELSMDLESVSKMLMVRQGHGKST
ncbi:putative monooxygenase [Cercophora newfieldiana]|uniref:Monooxygenase n=1 Tax=Cercophora newfieldiana TaxID=92897 RepID=A0AA39YJF5_9PEZI|nr:putative monooxygenase [Cercophora newfieldiana]